MSDVHFDPGEVSTPYAWSSTTLKVKKPPPMAAIKPLRLVAYDIDSYRMRRGWPEAVPELDIRARPVISIEGVHASDRMDPLSIVTAAEQRWVAGTDFYDPVQLSWRALQDAYGWSWVTAPEYAPELVEDYTYQVGSELVTRSALNFASENHDHFWSDFSAQSAIGFTLGLVASFRSPELQDMGLFCPGMPTPAAATEWAEFPPDDVRKKVSFLIRGTQLGVVADDARIKLLGDISDGLAKQGPLYVFLSVHPPDGEVYVARGTRSIKVQSFKTGAPGQFPLSYALGRTTGDVYSTADMALFEASFYSSNLTMAQITSEVALLASVYGGSQTS